MKRKISLKNMVSIMLIFALTIGLVPNVPSYAGATQTVIPTSMQSSYFDGLNIQKGQLLTSTSDFAREYEATSHTSDLFESMYLTIKFALPQDAKSVRLRGLVNTKDATGKFNVNLGEIPDNATESELALFLSTSGLYASAPITCNSSQEHAVTFDGVLLQNMKDYADNHGGLCALTVRTNFEAPITVDWVNAHKATYGFSALDVTLAASDSTVTAKDATTLVIDGTKTIMTGTLLLEKGVTTVDTLTSRLNIPTTATYGFFPKAVADTITNGTTFTANVASKLAGSATLGVQEYLVVVAEDGVKVSKYEVFSDNRVKLTGVNFVSKTTSSLKYNMASNKSVTAKYMALSLTDPEPSAETILLSGTPLPILAFGGNSVTFSGLNANTDYKIYVATKGDGVTDDISAVTTITNKTSAIPVPQFTNVTPTVNTPAYTSVNFNVTMDMDSAIRYAVRLGGASAPLAFQIGALGANAQANTPVNFDIVGLERNADYDIYLKAVGAEAESPVVKYEVSTADVTRPTFTDVVLKSKSETTVTYTITASEGCMLYVRADTGTEEIVRDASFIKSSPQATMSLEAGVAKDLEFTGLTDNTDYTLTLLLEDLSDNMSTPLRYVHFKTDKPSETPVFVDAGEFTTPNRTDKTHNTAAYEVISSTNGKIYVYSELTSETTARDAAYVRVNANKILGFDLQAGVKANVVIDNLLPNTGYTLYFVIESADGVKSAVREKMLVTNEAPVEKHVFNGTITRPADYNGEIRGKIFSEGLNTVYESSFVIPAGQPSAPFTLECPLINGSEILSFSIRPTYDDATAVLYFNSTKTGNLVASWGEATKVPFTSGETTTDLVIPETDKIVLNVQDTNGDSLFENNARLYIDEVNTHKALYEGFMNNDGAFHARLLKANDVIQASIYMQDTNRFDAPLYIRDFGPYLDTVKDETERTRFNSMAGLVGKDLRVHAKNYVGPSLDSSATFTESTPSVSDITKTSATILFKSSVPGAVKYVVVPKSTDVTKEQLTTDSIPNVKTVNFSGTTPHDAFGVVEHLTVDTEYKVVAIIKDTDNKYQQNVTTVNFKTLEDSIIEKPAFVDNVPTVGVNGFNISVNYSLTSGTGVKLLVLPSSDGLKTKDEVLANPNTIMVNGKTADYTFTLPDYGSYRVYVVPVDSDLTGSMSIVEKTLARPSEPSIPSKPDREPSSGGSSSGGSSSASPTPTPVSVPKNTGKVEVLVNGIREAVATVIDIEKEGQKLTSLTVDAVAMMEKITRELGNLGSAATPNKKLEVQLIVPETGTGTKKAELDAELMRKLIEKEVTLDLSTAIGKYNLPTAELKSLIADATKVELVIAKTDKAKQEALQTSAQARGITLQSDAIDFAINVQKNDKQESVERFSQFIPRTIFTANKQITTGVVMGKNGDVFHVPTFVTGNGTANVDAKINSLTNSSYAIILNDKSFEDIKGNPYEKAIKVMASRLVIEGTSETTFAPDKAITRAEFATLLTKALGLYRGEMGKASFVDMTAIEGLNIGISVASDNHLIKGVGANKMNPNANMTSEELAAMLYSAATLYAKPVKNSNNSAAVVSEGWAKDAVNFATAQGLIQNYKPGKTMNRAEAAYALYTLLVNANLINE